MSSGSVSLADSAKKGGHGDKLPDVLQSTSSSPSSSSVVMVGTLPQSMDLWKSITTNCFVLNMVKGHHLLLFCTLKRFNKVL